MKQFILITIPLVLLATTINGIQFCGIEKGWYVDVNTHAYKFYQPIERLTHEYIQIDSNY